MKRLEHKRPWQAREAVLEKAIRRRTDDINAHLPLPDDEPTRRAHEPAHARPMASGLRQFLGELQKQRDEESAIDRVLRHRTEEDGASEPPHRDEDRPIASEAIHHPHVKRSLRQRLADWRRKRDDESAIDRVLRQRTEDDGASEPPTYEETYAINIEPEQPSRWKRVAAAAAFGALSYGAAALGTLTMRGRGAPDKRWFRSLNKPAFQPPNWLFGPVWTVLYGTLAYSGYRIWRAERSPQRTRALAWWGAQLALNAAWTPLFFGARKPALALADIGALDVAATSYAVSAAKVDPTAVKVVAPYLTWLMFATSLNGSIVVKNR
jgi:tryptophan-rich sensory protein